ncbi:MAG TPA: mechanosensitive ion channel family protein [Acidimicrobiia bacterium]|nr:mechanosensitive ion channel family protein [Acidimicrobiia bacterium]
MNLLLAASGPPLQEGLAQTGVALAATLLVWVVLDQVGRRLLTRAVERHSRRDDVHGAERAQRIRTLWSVGRAVIAIVLAVVFLLLALGIWGIPITPFLAVGSVVGVAIGFGAQDLVKDVIAGMFIIAEDQYGIDDVVEVAGVSGRVEQIRLRTTVLRDLGGGVHHVPNGQITVASNFTQEFSQVVIDVDIAYEADVDHAIAVMQDEVAAFTSDAEWSRAFLGPPEMLGVEALGDSGVTLRLVLTVRPAYRLTARREFLRLVKNRFDAEGVEIPYQKLTVLRQEGSVTEPE